MGARNKIPQNYSKTLNVTDGAIHVESITQDMLRVLETEPSQNNYNTNNNSLNILLMNNNKDASR